MIESTTLTAAVVCVIAIAIYEVIAVRNTIANLKRRNIALQKQLCEISDYKKHRSYNYSHHSEGGAEVVFCNIKTDTDIFPINVPIKVIRHPHPEFAQRSAESLIKELIRTEYEKK